MSFLVPPRRYDPTRPEMMDRPGNDAVLLADDLHQLRIINRRFGGLGAVRRHLVPLMQSLNGDGPVRILDVATGSADHPIDVAVRARRAGRSVTVTAIDRNPFMVERARADAIAFPELNLAAADMRQLPFGDRAFDIAMCSLAIHHVSREDGIRVLGELKRVSRVGFIVNDLERSRFGVWIAWLYSRVATRNPITRHDAPASVAGAFTREELAAMCREAGIARFDIHRHPLLRLVVIGRHA